MNDYQSADPNPWNPFVATKRDIIRTEELSKKNTLIAGVLTFLFPPIGMIYLNRGVNCMKILGYLFILGFTVGMIAEPDEDLSDFTDAAGFAGTIALVVEQVGSINSARQRQKSKL